MRACVCVNTVAIASKVLSHQSLWVFSCIHVTISNILATANLYKP